jgi:hypothetical protein
MISTTADTVCADNGLFHAEFMAINYSSPFLSVIESVLLADHVLTNNHPLLPAAKGNELFRSYQTIENVCFYLGVLEILPDNANHESLI